MIVKISEKPLKFQRVIAAVRETLAMGTDWEQPPSDEGENVYLVSSHQPENEPTHWYEVDRDDFAHYSLSYDSPCDCEKCLEEKARQEAEGDEEDYDGEVVCGRIAIKVWIVGERNRHNNRRTRPRPTRQGTKRPGDLFTNHVVRKGNPRLVVSLRSWPAQRLGNGWIKYSSEESEDERYDLASSRGPITFSDQDLPRIGARHQKALHITARAEQIDIPQILIDNGSAINILTVETMHTLGIPPIELMPSSHVARAFDHSAQSILGVITLRVSFEREVFPVLFQVMDIKTSFNALLGRPWLHQLKAVASTVHQCVKFINSRGDLITIQGDEDLSTTSPKNMGRSFLGPQEQRAVPFIHQSIYGGTSQDIGTIEYRSRLGEYEYDQATAPDREEVPTPGYTNPSGSDYMIAAIEISPKESLKNWTTLTAPPASKKDMINKLGLMPRPKESPPENIHQFLQLRVRIPRIIQRPYA